MDENLLPFEKATITPIRDIGIVVSANPSLNNSLITVESKDVNPTPAKAYWIAGIADIIALQRNPRLTMNLELNTVLVGVRDSVRLKKYICKAQASGSDATIANKTLSPSGMRI